MQVLIATPAGQFSNRGNQVTATRWAEILGELDYSVSVAESSAVSPDDCPTTALVVIHACEGHEVVRRFRAQAPDLPILVCLSGTDLHLDLQNLRGRQRRQYAIESLDAADRIILLEPEGGSLLSASHRQKSATIFQSACPVEPMPVSLDGIFEVVVVGHLRDVKDPFLAAQAVRQLPKESRIQVNHLGAALSPEFEAAALQEVNSNPRYQWLGPVEFETCQQHLARSQIVVLTSRVEGAPSVISEAIVNRVPVLATRITATIGLLGDDYPGLFSVGAVESLRNLLTRVENDADFYQHLVAAIDARRPLFLRSAERAAWANVLASL